MVVRFPAHDLVLARVAPRDAHSQHGGFRSGGHKAHLIGTGNQATDALAPLQLCGDGLAKVRTVWGRADERLHHHRVRMAEQQRGRAQTVIDVLMTVHVPFAGSLTVRHHQGKGIGYTHVVADTSREDFPKLEIQLCRLGVSPSIRLTDGLSHGALLLQHTNMPDHPAKLGAAHGSLAIHSPRQTGGGSQPYAVTVCSTGAQHYDFSTCPVPVP